MATPKQTDPQFKLRLPQALKDQIEEMAKINNRSLNAEIVDRLEESFKWIDLIQSSQASNKKLLADMKHDQEVFEWMMAQQKGMVKIIEFIANQEGKLDDEFVGYLKSMIANRGKNTGFPDHPDDKE